MILDTLASKRGLEGVTSQTQGFGMDKYNPPKKKKGLGKLFGAIFGAALAFLTGGAAIPLLLGGALAGAAVGGLIDSKSVAKAGELQSKDISAIFEGVNAQDLGRGGYDIKNSAANKILLNGNTIATGQSDLSQRYPNVLSNRLGSKARSGQTSALVGEANRAEDMFFDFYMLDAFKMPGYKKADYSAKNFKNPPPPPYWEQQGYASEQDWINSRGPASGGLIKKLGGGYNSFRDNISGPRDSVPAMLQPGEFVLRKPAVDRMGVDAAIRLNSTGNVENDVNVEVNVINNGSPVTPTIQQTRRENGKIVVDVILEDVRNNGPIRQAIRGIK